MPQSASDPFELRLRAALDAAPSGMIMSDSEGRIVLVNRKIEALFGYAREELLGSSVERLLPERLRAAHVAHRAEFLENPRVRAMGSGRSLFGLRKDGTEVPLEIDLTPVVTEEGIFVLAAIADISERQRAEERFRIAVESSPNGMLMIDREGRLVLVNREIERMFGYAREELLGQPVEMLVPARYRGEHPAKRSGFFSSPHTRAMGSGRDLFGVRKDGSEIPVEIGLNPIRTENGLYVLGSVVDISARKRSESDRHRLEDQLRQAQKMEAIGRLASGIAHDFNNVLMGIIGCGGLLKRSLAEDHPGLPLLDDMCGAAQRGASLSRDLLNFSRRKPVDAVPSDLNAVVRVAERMLRQVIGEDIELVVTLESDGGHVHGNPTHLEHVLLNLVVNARDAMPSGGRLSIRTRDLDLDATHHACGRTLPPGRYVLLEVEDAGTGMDATTKEHLFEPFFTTKEPGTGTGLGLYTVYSIVEQLEGGIDFESELGQGTRFQIRLPRVAAAPGITSPPREVARVRSKAAAATRILVVEDDTLIRVTLRQMLGHLGYQVLVAGDGQTALAAVRESQEPLDLVLSDMVLPDASGADIAAVLAQEQPGLPVLFMSAYPASLLLQQGRIQPGTQTLEKPFDEEELARAIQDALLASEEGRVRA